jgi:hypothetical protein
MFFNRSIDILVKNLVILAGIVGIIAVQKPYADKLSSQVEIDYVKEEKQLEIFTSVQKQMPAFGFDNLVANFSFLGYIQYFGDNPARQATGYRLIPNYFEAVVKHDPRFIRAFLSLSTANSVFAGKPEKTIAFLNQSIKTIEPERQNFLDAFYLWNYQGIDRILFLGDVEGAKKAYLNAAKWAGEHRDEGSQFSARRALETVSFLESNPNPRKVQIAGWASVLTSARDDKTIQYAVSRLKALGAEIVITAQGELQVTVPEQK